MSGVRPLCIYCQKNVSTRGFDYEGRVCAGCQKQILIDQGQASTGAGEVKSYYYTHNGVTYNYRDREEAVKQAALLPGVVEVYMKPAPYIQSLLASMNGTLREWIFWKAGQSVNWAGPVIRDGEHVVDRASFDRVCRMLALVIEQRDDWITNEYPADRASKIVNDENERLEMIAKGEM